MKVEPDFSVRVSCLKCQVLMDRGHKNRSRLTSMVMTLTFQFSTSNGLLLRVLPGFGRLYHVLFGAPLIKISLAVHLSFGFTELCFIVVKALQ